MWVIGDVFNIHLSITGKQRFSKKTPRRSVCINGDRTGRVLGLNASGDDGYRHHKVQAKIPNSHCGIPALKRPLALGAQSP